MTTSLIHSGLVLEDLPDTQVWLKNLLNAAFPDIQIGTANSCQQAVKQIQTRMPDIALIDIGLPDGSGIDVIRHIKQQKSRCLCIISTMFDDDDHIFSALQAGADGYLLKDQSAEELTTLLHGIIKGHPPLSPAVARRILQFFQNNPPKKDADNCLTQRENEVLRCIAKGYTVAKTAEMNSITYNTAASYVKNIYRKLNISSRAEAATIAVRFGLLPD